MNTAEKKITQARVSMLFDHPFYGYLAMGLLLVEDNKMDMKTMATDGKHLYFDPKFVEATGVLELQGVIAHELCHCFLNHIPRRKNRLPKKWNYAIDYAANELVLKEFPLPKGILYDVKYAAMHAEQIYNVIDDPNEDDGPGTLDSHGKFDQWGEGEDDDPNGDGAAGSGTEQQWQEAVAQAATQARMRGNLPAHIAELVKGILHPKLDWRTYLQDYIISQAMNDFQTFPPNKRHLYRGFYLPSVTGQEIKIGVAVDTSGSCYGELPLFLGEVHGIVEAYAEYTIHLMTNDAKVHQKWELHAMDEIPSILMGGGGTDFRPVFEEMDKIDDITSVVFFTDLDGTFPKHAPTRYGVIWVATSELPAPFGTVIRYPMMKDS